MKHQHFLIHTIHDNTKNTKREVEELGKLLNDGCEIMDHFGYKDEQYFLLFIPHEEMDEKELN